MDLTPSETALIELMRSAGGVAFHVGLTSIGGVATLNVVADGISVSGIGPTFDVAYTNAYQMPDPPPPPAQPPRLAIVAGIDRAVRQ